MTSGALGQVRAGWRGVRFWFAFVLETLGARRLDHLLRVRIGADRVHAQGLDAIPSDGPVVFAVNHLEAGRTIGVVAAVLTAASCVRPRIDRDCALVVGHRVRPPHSRLQRVVRAVFAWVFARWHDNLLRIPGEGSNLALGALRAWRQKASHAPTLVFPEGHASKTFAGGRPGAGRWLAALGPAVVPVGVSPSESGWDVAFGVPVVWSHRPALHDLQLDLAIADLLPEALAEAWQPMLSRWRAVHDPFRASPSVTPLDSASASPAA